MNAEDGYSGSLNNKNFFAKNKSMDWKKALHIAETQSFAAIDFETADDNPQSACAIGIARVEELEVVDAVSKKIRPPDTPFSYSAIHGIERRDVEHCGSFSFVWKELSYYFDNVAFLAAHNAPFDRRVLYECCRRSALRPPRLRFLCSLRLSRDVLGFKRCDLPWVCKNLGIQLHHHDPLSDAVACAKIVIRAVQHNSFEKSD